MNYKLLSSVYYQNKQEYNNLFNQRYNSEATFHLPNIYIHDNPAFFIMLPHFSKTIDEIHNHNRYIKESIKHLPPIILNKFINENLIDEVMITNNIEGIYSTRKEINDIINAPKNAKKKLRFKGLVNKYQKLALEDTIELKTCQDVRNLYNDIVMNEIDPDNYPDGKIFRKDLVSVCSSTDKEKHKGVFPEDKIIDNLSKLLDFKTYNSEISELIKISIFHYILGYIHPFYDGNGRMNRFISSYFLSNTLENILVGLRISYTIKNNKNKYYKSFDICNDKKNKGDLTPFVIMFLDIIKKTALNIKEKMDNAVEKIRYYCGILENLNLNKKYYYECTFLMIQSALFGNNQLPIEEIADYIKKSIPTTRKLMNNIMQDTDIGLFISAKGNKKLYGIDLEKFEMFENK